MLTPPLADGDVVTMEEMDGSKSWGTFFNVCPWWGYLFRETQDPDAEWPRGLRWEMGRLFFRERLCISCVSGTCRWKAVVGADVVDH